MMRMLILTAMFAFGCQGQPKATPPAQATAESSAQAKPKKAIPKVNGSKSQQATKRSVSTKTKKRTRKKKEIKWVDSLTWHSWAKAQEISAETGRPIMLMIYANWCPRCRELAPIFQDPKIIAAAEKLVLVRQDQDERPDWLAQYREFGGYVPRIIFFGRDGQPRTDITSGRGKYPYFYTPRSARALTASMQKAATP